VGNTLEALLGALALRQLVGLRDTFDRLRHVVGLLVFAALLSTTVSATIGVASLHLAGTLRASAFETWRAWWIGDAIGDIVVGSLLLTWTGGHRQDYSLRRLIEVPALAVVLLAVLALVFQGAPAPEGRSAFRTPDLIFPAVFLVALRLGLRGATAAVFVTSAVAITSTALGAGPFIRGTLAQSLLSLQIYMALVGTTALLIGGTISEWARAVRARDEILAVVSHDLKGPLSAIRLSATLVKRPGAADTADARLQRHLDLVQRSTDRMSSIIRDLLDATTIDTGKISLCSTEGDACALVDEAVLLVQPAAQQKRQTIEIEKKCEGLGVVCDRERVLRVLGNLIGNAIKYTPEGGRIHVAVTSRERAICYAVTDTGVGIGAADLRRVFDPYFRADPGASEGSGLGLFIAKAIIEAHGGRIWATSTLGIGSSFEFTLPLPAPLTPKNGDPRADAGQHGDT